VSVVGLLPALLNVLPQSRVDRRVKGCVRHTSRSLERRPESLLVIASLAGSTTAPPVVALDRVSMAGVVLANGDLLKERRLSEALVL